HTRFSRDWSSDVCSSDLRIGFVAALFADLGQRAPCRFHQFAGDFRKKTRGLGSAQLLLIAKNAPVHGPRERQRLSRPGHPYVNEAALLLDSLVFVDGPAVRADAFFHTGEKHMIELEALGTVQCDQ